LMLASPPLLAPPKPGSDAVFDQPTVFKGVFC
jgi:hypothetical protein